MSPSTHRRAAAAASLGSAEHTHPHSHIHGLIHLIFVNAFEIVFDDKQQKGAAEEDEEHM